MTKEFNIEGWCNPEKHFMADISNKFVQVMQLVERGKYFTINRPHQYGKTSMLRLLTHQLSDSKDWLVFNISFEPLGNKIFSETKLFSKAFLEILELQMLDFEREDIAAFLKKEIEQVEDLQDLSRSLTSLANKANNKMVLLIDEVDSSSNQELFLDFLGLLRHKYLNRERKTERTFHSVILTGVHDIKTLKLKMRPEMTTVPYNSPWNIAADFEVEMSFRVEELWPMLETYKKDRGVVMDVETIATALIYYTSGYPFLVSSLCKIFDERILPKKEEKTWIITDLEKAVKLLVSKTNTNFDHLKKSLKNNKNLYQLTYNIAVNEQKVTFNVHNETIELGLMYGVFKRNRDNIGNLQIHNLIYQSIIFDFMVGQLENEVDINRNNLTDSYQLPNNQLDMEAVLQKFQLAMKEYYSKKDRDFLEKHGRLIFLSFLKPIINGSGFAFAEPQFSDEKRLDIAITFYQHKYVVELKIWRGLIAHKKGLEQLADYLELHNQKEGFLIIYDHRKKKSWNKKWVTVKKKRIYAVWL